MVQQLGADHWAISQNYDIYVASRQPETAAMITKIRIQNFLSFEDADISLGKQTVMVGANMTGKSNLFRAFRFLGTTALSGLFQAVQDQGGFGEMVWKGGRKRSIEFHLEAQYGESWGAPQTFYEYRLEFTADFAGAIAIEHEELSIGTSSSNKKKMADIHHGKGTIIHADGTEAFSPPRINESVLQFNVPGWAGSIFRNILASWRFYDLHPAAMRGFNPVVGQKFLMENGSNLSSWLLTIQTAHREYFDKMMQAVRSALPAIQELMAPPTQYGTTFLKSREEHLHSDITLFNMSAGELKYIALLSLICAPKELGAPLFCIEEPEAHLHPRLLESLVTVAEQVRGELKENAAQVLVTTHSPQLVDLTKLEDLIVFENKKGKTLCTRPADKIHLRKLLTEGELSLGELWFSGALGTQE